MATLLVAAAGPVSNFVAAFLLALPIKLGWVPYINPFGSVFGVSGRQEYIGLFLTGAVYLPVILGAFMLHGVQPGPQILATSSPIVYTVFASLYLGLILMCVLGYFAIRPLVRILDMPEAVVSAYVLILCFIGALSIRNNVTDLWLMIAFGIIGYLFERLRFPIAPLVLGVILGPLAEESFMNSMISFANDWTVFFRRPISGTVMAFTIVMLLLPFIQQWRAKRRVAAALRSG